VRQLRAWDRSRPLSFRKRAVAHQVPKRVDGRTKDTKIDVSDLDEILSIDPISRTCTAEPGVCFDRLVDETLRYGLVPTVVPELATITIGGAVSGCSIESMSYRYGGFHDSCLEYEVITAAGEILRCTPTNEHQLLFQMMHNSFGTLGFLSKLVFRLVPAKPFVHVRYETHDTLGGYQDAIARVYNAQGKDSVDFMDGIIHTPKKYVLSLGAFADDAPYTHCYDWVTVYYQTTAKRKEDWLRTKDYFFRYDRGVTNPTPRTFLGRLLFGKLLSSANVLRLAEKMPWLISRDRPDVTLDTFIPFSRMERFLDWYKGAINYFPMWVVPYRRVRDYEWIAEGFFHGLTDELFIDLAIYGLAQPKGRNYYREIEEALFPMQGLKTLISYNYYSPEEFWRVFNKRNYDAVKAITDPENAFRDLYTKMCRTTRGL
jgi:FAD/FMN-containing dehydrogenase